MNRIAKLLTLLSLLAGAVGCVSSYKHVMVSVVDATTGTPILGARVSTSYDLSSAWSRGFRRTSEAVTDAHGNALVSAYYPHREPLLFWRSEDDITPFYHASVTNDAYGDGTWDCAHSNTLKMLLARPAQFIPDTPDIVLHVTSEVEKARLNAEKNEQRENKRKADEQEAEDLFRNHPDFWPEHKWKDNIHLAVPDESGALLVRKRWESASKAALGAQGDLDSIRAVVMRHMWGLQTKTHFLSKVYEIRWVSPSVVMVSSVRTWELGGVVTFFYVLKKENSAWSVVTYYVDSIT